MTMLAPRRYRSLIPWAGLPTGRWFERMWEEFFGRPMRPAAEVSPEEWAPEVEMHQTDGELEVRFELPGIKKDEVTIEARDDYLSIRGERKPSDKACPEGGVCCTEFTYGPFSRTVAWPLEVKADQVKASYQDGILVVRAPLSERAKETKPRRVTIE